MASSESDEYYSDTEEEEEEDEDDEDEVTDCTDDEDDDDDDDDDDDAEDEDDDEEEDGDDDEDSDTEYSLDEVYEYEDDDDEEQEDDDVFDDAQNRVEEEAVEADRIKGWSSEDDGDEEVPALEHGDQVRPDEIPYDTEGPFSEQSTSDVSARDLPSDQQMPGDQPTTVPLKGNPSVPSTDPAMSSTVEGNVDVTSLPSDLEKMKIDHTTPA